MALTGKYQLVRDDGVQDYMIAHGLPDDAAKKILEESKNIEISVNGENISITRPGRVYNLINNKEVSETSPQGFQIKNTAVLNGNTLTVKSTTNDKNWTKIYAVSGSELTVTSVSTKPNVADGVLVYKRL